MIAVFSSTRRGPLQNTLRWCGVRDVSQLFALEREPILGDEVERPFGSTFAIVSTDTPFVRLCVGPVGLASPIERQ
jgi:hypothetical protein